MSIQVWSAEKFRQELAVLINRKAQIETERKEEIKQSCIKFLSLMPEFYGEELDRQKMWERIANGVIVSIAKSNKAWDKFINDMLIYIKADMIRVSSSDGLNELMKQMAEEQASYHIAWLRYFETRHMVLIPFARLVWQNKIAKSPSEKTFKLPDAPKVHKKTFVPPESVTNNGEIF